MIKKLIKILAIILILLFGCGYQTNAKETANSCKNFILPKTFKINDDYLPPLNTKPITKPTVKTTVTPVKTEKIVQPPPKAPVKPTVKTVSIPVKKDITPVSVPNIVNTVSLTNLVKSYKYSYTDTLQSTIISLSSLEITPVSYNTEKGQISAKLSSGKEIFILIVPFSENYTCVRITPTDGNYNLPMTTINQIFSAISDNLKTI